MAVPPLSDEDARRLVKELWPGTLDLEDEAIDLQTIYPKLVLHGLDLFIRAVEALHKGSGHSYRKCALYVREDWHGWTTPVTATAMEKPR